MFHVVFYCIRTLSLLLFLCCITGSALASDTPAPQAVEFEGVLRPVYDGQLSFALPGRLLEIKVKRGQYVKKGALMMHLNTRAENARLALLDNEIRNTIKFRTLETQKKQAKLDMERYQSALQENAATLMEFQHSELMYNLSVLALEEEQFRINQIKLNRKELLSQRDSMYLYAPINGYVEEIYVEKGMAVDRNIPAIRFVSIDPMMVELTLPVKVAVALKVGDSVNVVHPASKKTLVGKVVHVAKIAVLSNRTLKVRIHVPNPEGLSVGLMAKVSFPKK